MCKGPYDYTLCVSNKLRRTVNRRQNLDAFERLAPTTHTWLKTEEGGLLLWPGMHAIGCGYSPMICNGKFYEVTGVDPIVLGGNIALTRAQAARYIRASWALTVDSSQSKSLSGRVRVSDARQPRLTRARFLVAISRATHSSLLCVCEYYLSNGSHFCNPAVG